MDTFFSIIGMFFRALWAIVQFIALLISDLVGSLQNHQLRQRDAQRYRQVAAAKCAATIDKDTQTLIREVRDAQPVGWCVDFGKCAACAKELDQTDLDPYVPYFCSDACKERCINFLGAYDIYVDLSQAEQQILYKRQDAKRDEDFRHRSRMQDIQYQMNRRIDEFKQLHGYEPEYFMPGTFEAKSVPRAVRADQKEFQRLIIEEQKLHHEAPGRVSAELDRNKIAVNEKAAQNIRDLRNRNRADLTDLFANYKKSVEEGIQLQQQRDNERLKQQALENQWYKPLGTPPQSA